MDPKWIVVIVVAIVVAVAVWQYLRNRRSAALRRRFGPEYERAVREHRSERGAEEELEQREKRVQRFKIRDLEEEERERFAGEWHIVQTTFVDDPKGAVTQADLLVSELMQARGYPMAEFEQRAADLSVDHPRVVENYRAGHRIALRHRRGAASTEDLRKAMIYYRSLFDELLQKPQAEERKEVA